MPIISNSSACAILKYYYFNAANTNNQLYDMVLYIIQVLTM